MAGYTVRSLSTLSGLARGYFTQSVSGAVASVWANTFTVVAKVLALAGFELEQRRAWLVKQLFASTADQVWLVRHGFELGLTLDPAAFALGSASGPAPAGLTVPAGLQYMRGDGVVFDVIAAATTSGATVTLDLEADSAGASGNTDAGTTLTLLDPADAPAGTPVQIAVLAASDGSGLSGGADEEDIETFRARVLYRKRNPPMGGSAADYAEWVQAAVSGATAYIDSYANDARAVWVQFTVLNLPAGVDPTNQAAVLAAYVASQGGICIPTEGQIATAQAYIDDTGRRPVTARAFVTPPQRALVDVVIANLSPATADVVQAIELEIAATFLDRARVGTPSDDFVLSASWLDEAISRATGEDSHTLVGPGDLTFTAGQLPVLGSIAYQ